VSKKIPVNFMDGFRSMEAQNATRRHSSKAAPSPAPSVLNSSSMQAASFWLSPSGYQSGTQFPGSRPKGSVDMKPTIALLLLTRIKTARYK
jgi:hypothetical protein